MWMLMLCTGVCSAARGLALASLKPGHDTTRRELAPRLESGQVKACLRQAGQRYKTRRR
jgi:hypothetical protein